MAICHISTPSRVNLRLPIPSSNSISYGINTHEVEQRAVTHRGELETAGLDDGQSEENGQDDDEGWHGGETEGLSVLFVKPFPVACPAKGHSTKTSSQSAE